MGLCGWHAHTAHPRGRKEKEGKKGKEEEKEDGARWGGEPREARAEQVPRLSRAHGGLSVTRHRTSCADSHSADEQRGPERLGHQPKATNPRSLRLKGPFPERASPHPCLNTPTHSQDSPSCLSPSSLFFTALASAYNLSLSSPCCAFSVLPTSMSASGQSLCLQASASGRQEGPIH